MKLFTLLLLILLVPVALAASTSNTFTAEGRGAIIQNSFSSWQSGEDNNTIGGSSGAALLTAPGEFQYQTADNIDATTNNFYNSTGYTRFDAGGVFEESASIATSDPYQTVTGKHSGFLQTAEIETAKFIENADLSIGQIAAWDGPGTYIRDIDYSVTAETETDGHTYTYRTDSRDHRAIITNSSGGARARPEFTFTDFSDAFIFNMSTDINETLNKTESIQPASMGAMNQ